jgi:hypothetical protein
MEDFKTNKELQEGLEIVELDERLEMVQLSTSAAAAGSFRCDSTEE